MNDRYYNELVKLASHLTVEESEVFVYYCCEIARRNMAPFNLYVFQKRKNNNFVLVKSYENCNMNYDRSDNNFDFHVKNIDEVYLAKASNARLYTQRQSWPPLHPVSDNLIFVPTVNDFNDYSPIERYKVFLNDEKIIPELNKKKAIENTVISILVGIVAGLVSAGITGAILF